MVTLADMCLDLAMQEPAKASTHITRAKDSLDEVSENLTELRSYGANREAAEWTPFAVQAALRRSELDNWGNAAAGRPIQHDYDALLDTAVAVNFSGLDLKSWSTLIEFMPVLLGARARELGGTQGWLARLALAREEGKYTLAPGTNGNWDTAILPDDSPHDFSAPPIRVNLKLSGSGHADDYARSGVVVLDARSHGISSPPQIIHSCAQEAGGPYRGANSLLGTDELDAITARIFGTVTLADAA
jgi:hypothetical protein